MNKLLIATAAVAFATVGTASAADLPVKAAPMVAAAPVQSWTGCWVSGGVGYGMWNDDHNLETNPGLVALDSTVTGGGRGWLGRLGVGCDYQFNQSFLIGAFGDYDWMSLKGTNQNQLIATNNGTPVQADQKETGAWAIGARLGYLPYPNLLTYINGGWTQSRWDQMIDEASGLPEPLTGLGFPAVTMRGWFIGGGTEYRLPWFNGLAWKTEYRFADYRPIDLGQIVLATGAPTGFAEHSERFVQTVTTSLVWHFNFGGPVVARY